MRPLCCAFVLILFGAVVVAFYPTVGTWICIFGACTGAVGLCMQADQEDVVNEESETAADPCATP